MFQLYKAFTTYEGMYISSIVPIVYFSGVIFTTAFRNLKLRKKTGVADVMASIAMFFIAADFSNYLYLFFNHAGKLLPPGLLLLKYGLGACFWLWVFVYCYRAYFSRQAAGHSFRQRWLLFAIMTVLGMILAGFGIAFLPAHTAVA